MDKVCVLLCFPRTISRLHMKCALGERYAQCEISPSMDKVRTSSLCFPRTTSNFPRINEMHWVRDTHSARSHLRRTLTCTHVHFIFWQMHAILMNFSVFYWFFAGRAVIMYIHNVYSLTTHMCIFSFGQLKSKGYEALYCIDPLDELCMLEIKKFGEFEIVDLSKNAVAGIDDNEETVSCPFMYIYTYACMYMYVLHIYVCVCLCVCVWLVWWHWTDSKTLDTRAYMQFKVIQRRILNLLFSWFVQKKEKESKQIEFDAVCKFLAQSLGTDKVSAVEASLSLCVFVCILYIYIYIHTHTRTHM